MDSLNLAILYVTWFDRDIDCFMVQTEVKKYVLYFWLEKLSPSSNCNQSLKLIILVFPFHVHVNASSIQQKKMRRSIYNLTRYLTPKPPNANFDTN
ncbi:Translocation protein sec63 [Fusarium oxysporum f. sp. albedinis]|jgi:hypothetical protein|nr:Translocation protein sec63 [Fusarium oxysporum f. sp. albedinis]